MSADLIPGAEHHLYVVEIIGIGVKVGISAKPDRRIAQHVRDALAYGRQTGRVWVSAPHQEARANEAALVRLSGGRREYLPITFDAAVAAAAELPMTRADRAGIERRQAAVTDFFKSVVLGGVR